MIASRLIVCTLLLTACATESSNSDPTDCAGGKCDLPADQSCADVRYADGVCQVDLACAVPDADCFITFANDVEAAAWWGRYEPTLAAEQGRGPRTFLAPTDPRFAYARRLLDEAWARFLVIRPVGLLAAARPGLVVLDDPTANAFVAPDLQTDLSAFAVMVQTGFLAAATDDDAKIGVMVHELQHAVGLHLIRGGKQRMQRFYFAAPDREPIGRITAELPIAREAFTTWKALADEVGHLDAPELGGIPLHGNLANLYVGIVKKAAAANPPGCSAATEAMTQLRTDVMATIDPLTDAAVVAGTPIPARIASVHAALRDRCMPGATISTVEAIALVLGSTPQAVDASLTPQDRALVAGRHALDGLALLIADRRAKMQLVKARVVEVTGRPWSMLRYFSYEEDADDVSVPVLRSLGRRPAAQGDLLATMLPEGARARCGSVIAAGQVPPYGENLADEHHSLCWRIYHLHAIAALTSTPTAARTEVVLDAAAPSPFAPPPTLRDRLSH